MQKKKNDKDICFTEIVDVSLSFRLQQTSRGKDGIGTNRQQKENISAE